MLRHSLRHSLRRRRCSFRGQHKLDPNRLSCASEFSNGSESESSAVTLYDECNSLYSESVGLELVYGLLRQGMAVHGGADKQVRDLVGLGFSLSGKVAVITGGVSGLGLEYSLFLAQLGATVYVIDGSKYPSAGFEASVDYIKRQQSGSLRYVQVDISKEPLVTAVFSRIFSKHGHLDICVACTTLVGPDMNICHFPHYFFRRMLEVNLSAVLLTIQAASQLMKQTRPRHQVLTTKSVPVQDKDTGFIVVGMPMITPSSPWVPFNVVQAALEEIAQGFAVELKPHCIRVQTLTPPYFPIMPSEPFFTKYSSILIPDHLNSSPSHQIPNHSVKQVSKTDDSPILLRGNDYIPAAFKISSDLRKEKLPTLRQQLAQMVVELRKDVTGVTI